MLVRDFSVPTEQCESGADKLPTTNNPVLAMGGRDLLRIRTSVLYGKKVGKQPWFYVKKQMVCINIAG